MFKEITEAEYHAETKGLEFTAGGKNDHGGCYSERGPKAETVGSHRCEMDARGRVAYFRFVTSVCC